MTRGRSTRRPPRMPFGERSSASHVTVCSPEELEALLVSARGRRRTWWALWVSWDGRVRLSRVYDRGVVLFDRALFPYFSDAFLEQYMCDPEVGTIVGSPLSRCMETCGLERLEGYAPSRLRWLEGVLASLRNGWWQSRRGGAR